MTRGPSLLAAACGAALAVWLLGFVWFVVVVGRDGEEPPAADGIVVLTGGADRVAAGLRLLEAGKARQLLISGVGPGAELASLARDAGLASPPADQVTLGRDATSTAGNATETADWVRARGLRSVIIVTAGYHMPRALTELGRSLPGVALYPSPVRPPALRGPPDIGTLRLLAIEYSKLLAARLGLSRLDPPAAAPTQAAS